MRSYRKNEYTENKITKVTYKYNNYAGITCVANTASLTINPVYEFVNSDARYANFIKTCNEWRVAAIKMKMIPFTLVSTDIA